MPRVRATKKWRHRSHTPIPANDPPSGLHGLSRALPDLRNMNQNNATPTPNVLIRPGEATNNDPPDFWTGRSQARRPPSRRSRSSSMNSSLYGTPKFDPHEQDPIFPTHRSYSSATGSEPVSPCLPPPPIQLGKDFSFDCDICGETVKVARRLEWQ